jgi:hypothetical protein
MLAPMINQVPLPDMFAENLRSGFLSLPDLGAGRLAVELTYASVY